MTDVPLSAVQAAIQGLCGGAHAPLPPSSADRWWHCPGSVYMGTLAPPEIEGEPAREGTAAHWAACEEASGRGATVGQITPEGWVLDQDQIDGAEQFAKHLPPAIMNLALLEQKLYMNGPRVHIHQHCSGTTDLGAVDHNARRAYLSDYKYGHGYVPVYQSPQLVLYGAGLVNRVPAIGPGWTFEFAIVQPRVYHRDGHVRRWVATYEELEPIWTSLAWAAEEATGANPRLQTGPHCEHCPARHMCPALHADVSEISRRLEVAAPLDLPDNALGFELRQLYRMKELLDARISGLEVDATTRIRSGRSLPWLKLDSKPGRSNWTVPDRVAVDIAKLSGFNIAKDVKAMTPTQALKAGVPASVVEALSARGTTSMKLEVVDTKDVRRIFIDKSLN